VDLGRVLAEAREAKGIPLPVLAEQNYLSQDRLQALEDGDHTRLPERIYLIAQARRVATSLGLDADALTEPLMDIHLPAVGRSAGGQGQAAAETGGAVTTAAPAMASPAAAPRPAPVSPATGSRRTLPRLLPALLLVAGILTALVLGWRQFRPAATGLGGTEGGPAAREGEGATGSTATAPAQGSLEISSLEPSWLEVRDGEGKALFRGLFTGKGRFSLAAGLEVLAGRPDLITVRVGAGKPSVLGTIDQVSWQRFSPTGEQSPAN
jgi:transcriptional regulator with XRE-family HTH domain